MKEIHDVTCAPEALRCPSGASWKKKTFQEGLRRCKGTMAREGGQSQARGRRDEEEVRSRPTKCGRPPAAAEAKGKFSA